MIGLLPLLQSGCRIGRPGCGQSPSWCCKSGLLPPNGELELVGRPAPVTTPVLLGLLLLLFLLLLPVPLLLLFLLLLPVLLLGLQPLRPALHVTSNDKAPKNVKILMQVSCLFFLQFFNNKKIVLLLKTLGISTIILRSLYNSTLKRMCTQLQLSKD